MWQRPPSSDHAGSQPAHELVDSPQSETSEFGRDERASLLRVAHDAITAAVEGIAYSPQTPPGVLSEPRGVFTTLYHRGKLRGCVGYVSAVRPLIGAVAETAAAAALHDTRFPPVEHPELDEIQISLSVLSPTFAIEPAQIQIGRHGLIIFQHDRRGLLLPQVASAQHWDAETFLEQTCHKAGLPGNAWKQGAQIEAFTAEIFGDPDLRES